MRRRRLVIVAGASLVAACTARVERSSATAPAATTSLAMAANPALGIWPSPLDRAPAAVRDVYSFAIGHESILRWIPCYCGCGSDGHKNNFDCYVRETGDRGWVVLDTHGYG